MCVFVCVLTASWVRSCYALLLTHTRTHTQRAVDLCDFSRSDSLSLVLVFSPFEVVVGPEAGPQQIRAWGPGLEGGIVGKPATFVVESIGSDVGVLGESFIRPVFIL